MMNRSLENLTSELSSIENMHQSRYIEQIVTEKTAEVLHITSEELRRDLTLIEQGMDSIDMLRLRYHLEKALSKTVPTAALDIHFTLPQLIQQILPIAETAGTDPALAGVDDIAEAMYPEIVCSAEELHTPFPLNDMQSAFMAGRRLKIDGDWVGGHLYYEFESEHLDGYRLNQAWQRLIDIHPMLRAEIQADGQQKILAHRPYYKFNQFDFSGKTTAISDIGNTREKMCTEKGIERNLLRLRHKMSHKVYTVSQWPLFEICIVHLPGKSSLVLLSIDEWVVDAHSLNILVSQWQSLYLDPSTELPCLQISFRDYIVAIRRFEGSVRFQGMLTTLIEGCASLPCGPDLPLNSKVIDTADRFLRKPLTHTLDKVVWLQLKEKAAALGISTTSLLLGLFSEVLRQQSGQDQFTLNLTYFNRPPLHPQINQVVGPFTSNQLFVVEFSNDRSLEDQLVLVDQKLKEVLDSNQISGIRLLRELKVRQRLTNNVILPVVFTSLLNIDSLAASSDGTVESPHADSAQPLFKTRYELAQTPQVYLDHQAFERDGTLHLIWYIAERVYAEGVLAELFEQYCCLLTVIGSGQVSAPVLLSKPEDQYKSFPLTAQQLAYAFARSQYLKGESNSCQLYYEINSVNLDISRLEAAWQILLSRHPALITHISANGQQQVMERIPHYSLPCKDLSREPASTRKKELTRIKETMIARSVPLGEWPFFAIQVSLLPDNEARIHFAIDMIIADGFSIQLVIMQWLSLYGSLENTSFPDSAVAKNAEGNGMPEVTFRDYVMALEAYKQTENYQSDLAYWQEKFAGFSGGPPLPRVHPAPAEIERRRFSWVCSGWQQLSSKAQSFSLSVSVVLLAVYLEVLAKGAGNKPFEVVIPCWERLPLHPQINRVVGDFTYMSWIAADFSGRNFVEKCRGYLAVMQADAHHRSVNGIVALRNTRDSQGKPLRYPIVYSELIAVEDQSMDDSLSRLGFTLSNRESKTGGVEIDHITDLVADHAVIHWDVSINIFPRGLIEKLFNEYQSRLHRLIEVEEDWIV